MALTQFFNGGTGSVGLLDPFPSLAGSMFDLTNFFDTERTDNGAYALGFCAEVDWTETQEAHVLKADLPGLRKEDIKVEVLEGNTLRISGERLVEKRNETDSWHYVERSSGKFRRQFGVPQNSKVEDVSAKVEDGVLTITVPKSKGEAPKVKAINVA